MTSGAGAGRPEQAEQSEQSEQAESAVPETSGTACGCSTCPADSAADSNRAPGGPAASVVACPDGPLLVRGDFEIVTPDGVPIPRDRETVALCRCGGSAIKPYCDGTHKLMKFDTSRRRPVPAAVAGQATTE